MEIAFLDTRSNQLIGKDISINLDNKSFNKDNEPRIKGKSIIYNNGYTEVTKGSLLPVKELTLVLLTAISRKIQHDPKERNNKL